MPKVKIYEIKEELAETRKLFTLLDPLTNKKDVMIKIVEFYSERIHRNNNLEKELEVAKTECKIILNSVTNLLQQLDTPISTQSLDWKQEFSRNNNSVENLLQQASRVLEQVSDSSILEVKRISNILKQEREQQILTGKTSSNSGDNSDLFSGESYHKLLRIMKRYPRISVTSVSSALYTLQLEGHGRFADKFKRYFCNDKDAMVNFFSSRIQDANRETKVQHYNSGKEGTHTLKREKKQDTKKPINNRVTNNPGLLSGEPYHELLRIMKRYSEINVTSVTSALYTLRREGHERLADKFKEHFRSDKNAMVSFLKSKLK